MYQASLRKKTSDVSRWSLKFLKHSSFRESRSLSGKSLVTLSPLSCWRFYAYAQRKRGTRGVSSSSGAMALALIPASQNALCSSGLCIFMARPPRVHVPGLNVPI